MADNLKQLQENVDTVIPLNGGVASVKVVNHNPHTKEIIEKAGRLTGFPFKAGRTPTNNNVPVGTFFWNGNAMNKITPFDITVNNNTMDGNYLDRILALCTEGTIIHFKDFVGRSTTLKFISYSKAKEVLTITVVGFAENTNYAYQVGEEELCMLEFVGVSGNNNITNSPLDNTEINLFWGQNGFNNNYQPYSKSVDMFKTVTNFPFNFKTIPTEVNFLGIEINNWAELEQYNPRLVIERYRRRTKGRKGNQQDFRSPAKYRQQEIEEGVYAYDPSIESTIFLTRPKKINLTGEKVYYDIYAENYYDIKRTPEPRTNKGFVTNFTVGQSLPIKDDSGKYQIDIPQNKKGFVHLRARIEINFNNQVISTKPLVYFKIVNSLKWLGYFSDSPLNENAVFGGRIAYQYE